MDNSEYDSVGALRKIFSQDSIVEVLVEIERILDTLDIYVFPNWIKGAVVSEPKFKRHWVTITLRYPYNSKPDVMGAERLKQHDIDVKYEKGIVKIPVVIDDELDADDSNNDVTSVIGNKKTEIKDMKVYYVTLTFPRHLITDIETPEVDIDDQTTVDMADVQDAEENGLDDMVVDDEEENVEEN